MVPYRYSVMDTNKFAGNITAICRIRRGKQCWPIGVPGGTEPGGKQPRRTEYPQRTAGKAWSPQSHSCKGTSYVLLGLELFC